MSKPLVSKSGRVLTDEVVEQLADEAEAGYDLSKAKVIRVGRPSLTGEAKHSPRIDFRTTPEKRAEAEAVAAEQGVTVSALARQAFEEYLTRQRAS